MEVTVTKAIAELKCSGREDPKKVKRLIHQAWGLDVKEEEVADELQVVRLEEEAQERHVTYPEQHFSGF